MGRRPCCDKREGLNRGAWTAMEDKLLTDHIKLHGEGRWRSLPKKAGLKRCGKSCRLRWLNYLRPDIKRGNINEDEEELIIRLHKLLGNRWSLIAGRLPGRTDNEIKNYWNTNLSKKVIRDDHHDRKDSKSSTTEVITPKLQPRRPDSSVVFRTKAYKCTRVFITSPPPPLPPPPPQQPLCTRKQDHAEAPECSKYVEFSDPIMDFPTMDFNMSFDEFFNSQLNPDTVNGDDPNSLPWLGSEMPSGVLSEEMMEAWTGNDFAFDVSLLETWLGV